jgi:diaminohydroxyphosphoribosylaminopyrimidine deaminase/5-amino-6-(5-phosphoribosylamino)uracil reductase
MLTARDVWRDRPLVRVVFDWRLRVPPRARLFSTRHAGPVIMVVGQTAAEAHPDRVEALARAGAEVRPYPARNLAAALESLGSADVTSLLVEGGPALQQAFVEGDLADRVQWIETPVHLDSGVAASPALIDMRRAFGSNARVTDLGPDRLLEWDM